MNVVEDLGAKVSYLALAVGTRVYDVDSAPVGVVEHVLADEGADIFHGVIVALPDGSHRFAHRDQIADLYERGVVPGAGCRAARAGRGHAGQGDRGRG